MAPEHTPDAQEPAWKAPVDLAVHLLVGIVLFLLVAAPAVGLDFWLHHQVAAQQHAGGQVSLTLHILSIVKIGHLCIDVLLYGLYVVNTAQHFIRGLKWRK